MASGTFTISKVPQAQVKEMMDLFNGNQPPPTSVPAQYLAQQ